VTGASELISVADGAEYSGCWATIHGGTDAWRIRQPLPHRRWVVQCLLTDTVLRRHRATSRTDDWRSSSSLSRRRLERTLHRSPSSFMNFMNFRRQELNVRWTRNTARCWDVTIKMPMKIISLHCHKFQRVWKLGLRIYL